MIADTNEIELHMREFQANVMPSTFVPATGAGTYTGTWVWGYIVGPNAPATALGTYLGPVIVTTRNQPTQIRFVNDLTADHIAWREWTDQPLHWADPLNGEANMCAHMGGMPMGYCAEHYQGPIPAVPHLHGGEVPPVLDGGPDAWFTSDGLYHGHGYYTKAGADANEAIYRYPNTMEAAPIWFHDHLLGGTHLTECLRRPGGRLPVHRPGPEPPDRPAPRWLAARRRWSRRLPGAHGTSRVKITKHSDSSA